MPHTYHHDKSRRFYPQNAPHIEYNEDNKNKSGLFEPPFLSQAHADEHMAGATANQQVPPGVVTMFAGVTADIPEGWIRCDGTAVSRKEYVNLYEVIGETYGAGDGVNTFNVPDIRTRFPVGQSSTTGAIGTTGGDWNHFHGGGTLATGSTGAHTHGVNGTSGNAGSHSHGSAGSHSHTGGSLVGDQNISADTQSGSSGLFIASLDTHTHNISGSTASGGSHDHGSAGGHDHGAGTYDTSSAGGHAHATVAGETSTQNPPFIALQFIIKT